MGRREDLNSKLVELMSEFVDDDLNHVYYQPPATVRMNYPCIVYRLSTISFKYANDLPYGYDKAYDITVIDNDPDSEIPEALCRWKYCRFDRHYTADNLHHFVFRIFY